MGSTRTPTGSCCRRLSGFLTNRSSFRITEVSRHRGQEVPERRRELQAGHPYAGGARILHEKTYYPYAIITSGSAFIAAGRKKDALDALKKGLKYDSGNSDLKKELQTWRAESPAGGLPRPVQTPINVVLGMIRKSPKKTPPGKKSGGGT